MRAARALLRVLPRPSAPPAAATATTRSSPAPAPQPPALQHISSRGPPGAARTSMWWPSPAMQQPRHRLSQPKLAGGISTSTPLRQHRRTLCSKAVAPDDVYVNVLATPNPNALKFMPGCDVTATLNTVTVTREGGGGGGGEASEKAAQTELAVQLLALPGVDGVMFGFDFVTLRKGVDAEWDAVEEPAVAILQRFAAEAMQKEEPILGGVTSDQDIGEEEGSVARHVRELLQEYVRPNVQADGGDVQFCGFKDGVVWLSLTGACTSCPSSTSTVRVMIKNLLQHHCEEVTDVRPVDDADPFAEGYVKGVKID